MALECSGMIDWGEVHPNLSFFSGVSLRHNDNQSLRHKMGLIYVKPNWGWAGELTQEICTGRNLYNENVWF